EPISKYRLVLARCGTFVGDDVRLENQSACGSIPHPQLLVHRRRFHPNLDGVEGTLRRTTTTHVSELGSLQLRSPSPVCRIYHGDVWISAAVANNLDACHVSRADRHVHQAFPDRGTRFAGGIRRSLRKLRRWSTGLHSKIESHLWRSIERQLSPR